MSSKSYDRHWAVFLLAAQPILETVRERLEATGFLADAVLVTNGNDERALGFKIGQRGTGQHLYVDLWLMDGQERGLGVDEDGNAKVGVSLTVVDQDGVERFTHTPFNFSKNVGVSGSLELMERVNGSFDVASVLSMVGHAASSFFPTPARPSAVSRVSASALLAPGF